MAPLLCVLAAPAASNGETIEDFNKVTVLRKIVADPSRIRRCDAVYESTWMYWHKERMHQIKNKESVITSTVVDK
jgi:hypothetical protein